MTTTSFPRIPGHRRCCEILGNGDFRAGKELIQQLAHRLEHARAKHPWPGAGYAMSSGSGAKGVEPGCRKNSTNRRHIR